jgi:geranylgeranyl diphosphate synthase type II
MDKAATRRGKPSVHARWGEATAILAGDLLFSKAIQQIQYYNGEAAVNSNSARLINQSFMQAVDTVCEGQALDLEFAGREEVTLDEYLTMIEKKTASLLGTSLYLGGLVGNFSGEQCNKLFEIGKKAGIAFQIQDDLLDVTANPEKFGKQRGGDIIEGKKTYLSILASNTMDREKTELVNKVLRKENVREADINQVIELYKEFHIIEETEKVVKSYYKDSLEILDQFSDDEYKAALSSLIENLQYRER